MIFFLMLIALTEKFILLYCFGEGVPHLYGFLINEQAMFAWRRFDEK